MEIRRRIGQYVFELEFQLQRYGPESIRRRHPSHVCVPWKQTGLRAVRVRTGFDSSRQVDHQCRIALGSLSIGDKQSGVLAAHRRFALLSFRGDSHPFLLRPCISDSVFRKHFVVEFGRDFVSRSNEFLKIARLAFTRELLRNWYVQVVLGQAEARR